eukprot:scpid26900/ scgid6224/ Nuclear receptor coactivator 5; Coactivator independent of AF-2
MEEDHSVESGQTEPTDEQTDDVKDEESQEDNDTPSKRGIGGPGRGGAGRGKSKREQIAQGGRMTNSTDPNMKKARIFVGNLAVEKIKRTDLQERFSKYGEVTGVSVHRNYAFVQFAEESAASDALDGENNADFGGRKMSIQRAQGETQERRPAERRRRRSRSRERERDNYESQLRRRWEEDRYGHRGGGSHGDRAGRRDPSPRRDDYRRYERSRSPPPPGFDYERESRSRDRHDPYYDTTLDRAPSRDRSFYPSSDHHRPRSPDVRSWPDTAARERAPSPRPAQGPLDCEVLITTVDIRRYGEMIARRVRSMGLAVEMVLLTPGIPLIDMLDDACRRRLLFSVLVTEQHELHGSCTVHVLNGPNKQEHKNMPLEDAMALLSGDRKSDEYARGGSAPSMYRRSPSPPPLPRRLPIHSESPHSDVLGASAVAPRSRYDDDLRTSEAASLASALSQVSRTGVAGAENLSTDELSTLINALQRKQQSLAGSSDAVSAGVGSTRAPGYDRAPYSGRSLTSAAPTDPDRPRHDGMESSTAAAAAAAMHKRKRSPSPPPPSAAATAAAQSLSRERGGAGYQGHEHRDTTAAKFESFPESRPAVAASHRVGDRVGRKEEAMDSSSGPSASYFDIGTAVRRPASAASTSRQAETQPSSRSAPVTSTPSTMANSSRPSQPSSSHHPSSTPVAQAQRQQRQASPNAPSPSHGPARVPPRDPSSRDVTSVQGNQTGQRNFTSNRGGYIVDPPSAMTAASSHAGNGAAGNISASNTAGGRGVVQGRSSVPAAAAARDVQGPRAPPSHQSGSSASSASRYVGGPNAAAVAPAAASSNPGRSGQQQYGSSSSNRAVPHNAQQQPQAQQVHQQRQQQPLQHEQRGQYNTSQYYDGEQQKQPYPRQPQQQQQQAPVQHAYGHGAYTHRDQAAQSHQQQQQQQQQQ